MLLFQEWKFIWRFKSVDDNEGVNNPEEGEKLSLGQVVPLIMLLAPVLILWDHFVGRRVSNKLSAEPKNADVDDTLTQSAVSLAPYSDGADISYDEYVDILIQTRQASDKENIRFRRLRRAEVDSLATVSSIPLLLFAQSSDTFFQTPLGRFELLPWFPFLFGQVLVVTTVVIVLAWMTFSGNMRGDDPVLSGGMATMIASYLAGVLMIVPLCHYVYILSWPRNMYSFGLGQKISPSTRKLIYGIITSLFSLSLLFLNLFGPLGFETAIEVPAALYGFCCLLWIAVFPNKRLRVQHDWGLDQDIPLDDLLVDGSPLM